MDQNLMGKLAGLKDARSLDGIFARGKNVYNGASTAANQGPQNISMGPLPANRGAGVLSPVPRTFPQGATQDIRGTTQDIKGPKRTAAPPVDPKAIAKYMNAKQTTQDIKPGTIKRMDQNSAPQSPVNPLMEYYRLRSQGM